MAIEKAIETQYGVDAGITVIKKISASLETGTIDITYYCWKDAQACSDGAAPLEGTIYGQSLEEGGGLLAQVLAYGYQELLQLPKFEGGKIVPDPIPTPPPSEEVKEEIV